MGKKCLNCGVELLPDEEGYCIPCAEIMYLEDQEESYESETDFEEDGYLEEDIEEDEDES